MVAGAGQYPFRYSMKSLSELLQASMLFESAAAWCLASSWRILKSGRKSKAATGAMVVNVRYTISDQQGAFACCMTPSSESLEAFAGLGNRWSAGVGPPSARKSQGQAWAQACVGLGGGRNRNIPPTHPTHQWPQSQNTSYIRHSRSC